MTVAWPQERRGGGSARPRSAEGSALEEAFEAVLRRASVPERVLPALRHLPPNRKAVMLLAATDASASRGRGGGDGGVGDGGYLATPAARHPPADGSAHSGGHAAPSHELVEVGEGAAAGAWGWEGEGEGEGAEEVGLCGVLIEGGDDALHRFGLRVNLRHEVLQVKPPR